MKSFVRILMIVLVISLITFFFSSCGNSGSKDAASSEEESTPTQNESSSSDKKSAPLDISFKVHSQTIKDDDGTELVSFKFSYPYIANPDNEEGITAINDYYESQIQRLVTTVMSEGKKAALEAKKAAEEGEFDFHPLVFQRESTIYYNYNNLLSVLNLEFENTGGAHPLSYWSSVSFDVKTGKKLALSDILGLSKEESLEKVYEIVIEQIEDSKDKEKYYFENYEENVKNYYSEDDFVLSPEGLIFYFQPYAIAPYAAGIPIFDLPYSKAVDLSIEIVPIEPNDHERDAYLQAGKLIEANKEVFYNIFGLSMLPLEMPEIISEDQSIFPVKDNRFTTFSDLDNYIRGIYVKEEADALMGTERYIEKDGKLYGDIYKDAGMGYYVDWNNYRYELNDISETEATIKIYTVDDSPAGREEITIEVKMLKENDSWLLEKMFS
jgi:hypothetical protein